MDYEYCTHDFTTAWGDWSKWLLTKDTRGEWVIVPPRKIEPVGRFATFEDARRRFAAGSNFK